jgi:hypothetical protein
LAVGAEAAKKAPHLTVGIRHNMANVQLTIPNRLPQQSRLLAIGGSVEDFTTVVGQFADELVRVIDADSGCHPFVEVIQRHYPSQTHAGIVDALLEFDPRTLQGEGPIRPQPQWADAAYAVLNPKTSNVQVSFGVRFPYQSSTTVSQPDFLESVAEALSATKHIIDRWRAGQ